ncbi:dipicolinate synthase subunit B [Sulfobacillus thermosulfidooxidans]|uniref:Dipicolinate synthase subunit B n=2 Tax=Sulfobacillus thermosulfidooxidans TaxID=28034 RepID=A0A1W1WLM1_SULTA|nr:dipicolinate synthase subunit B [Sulfobacillus thermosulfidooxidans]OLZ12281.1 dipicolinate synthase subunit B [Sulfobacillus thermosulfidooxidans]OLZ12938.1 dipicolinate synthase subunit B [Sulfobacillus thermosulfidooxidans]OLZ21739.1 dipicolinate synthase subunit B [Sulfobacillus thermosulfidooxidans]PSR27683.1 MAG: dipicolinate synthase subunit B [Sulfobacillus thermosulfidooxidans]SMC06623.1 dipicolinate synthase subunit B [Sulfobacillus thermosulfidooxidans DSM 9293]
MNEKELAGIKIGVAMAASHCNMHRAVATMRILVEHGAIVTPIVSPSILHVSTRFGSPDYWKDEITKATDQPILTTIPEVEPSGPKHWFDIVVVMPCTGNTLAKIANAINDSPVTMTVKAQLRNGGPVLLAITSNDLLGMNAMNLGRLLSARNIYFVPFGQDDPIRKPRSLDAHLELIIPSIQAALKHEQVQPILVPWDR